MPSLPKHARAITDVPGTQNVLHTNDTTDNDRFRFGGASDDAYSIVSGTIQPEYHSRTPPDRSARDAKEAARRMDLIVQLGVLNAGPSIRTATRRSMALQLVENLLNDPDPAFACYANRDPTKKEQYLVPLAHFANPAAAPSLLDCIPQVPGAQPFKDVLAKYNGLLLYTDREYESEGVEIFPLNEWEERTAQMVESWAEEPEHYPDDDMPYGRNDFIAIAHSRGASSYIHWVIRGPRAGAVYWWPWTMRPKQSTPPMADDFAAFVRLLYERPAHFFNKLLLCYMRFSDGRTMTEWLPGRYLPDQQNPSIGR